MGDTQAQYLDFLARAAAKIAENNIKKTAELSSTEKQSKKANRKAQKASRKVNRK